jgi:hypothetical protein
VYGTAPPNYSLLPPPTVRQEPSDPAEPARPEPATPGPAKPEPVIPKPVAPGAPPGNPSASAPAAPSVKPAAFAGPEAAPAGPRPVPKGDVPRIEVPQVPVPGAPAEKPKGGDANIPPLVPRLQNPDVPPLTIPQLPVEPPAATGTSTSKASPLTGTAAPRGDVYPVDGPPPATPTARRRVGFFNHTDRDVRLTVEGQSVTLPGRHFVTAEVPAKFGWRLDGGEERRTEVPAAAPGVEVVIRK